MAIALTHDAVQELIKNQPPEIRTKGMLLYNGYTSSARMYNDSATAANLRSWQAAEEALAAFVDTLDRRAATEAEQFANLAEVLGYLRDAGWKATKASLYRHKDEGKIRPRPTGAYHLADVEKYARTFLKQQATGKRIQERVDDLQRKKLEKELQNLELEISRKTFAFDRDQGKYIPKELMDIELAGRAGILEAGLKHWIQSHAADWIRMSEGNTKKAGELIQFMNHSIDEHINEYASVREYRVIIDDDEPGLDTETGEEGDTPE